MMPTATTDSQNWASERGKSVLYVRQCPKKKGRSGGGRSNEMFQQKTRMGIHIRRGVCGKNDHLFSLPPMTNDGEERPSFWVRAVHNGVNYLALPCRRISM